MDLNKAEWNQKNHVADSNKFGIEASRLIDWIVFPLLGAFGWREPVKFPSTIISSALIMG